MEISERFVGDVTVLTVKGRLILEEVEAQLRDTVDAIIQQGRLKLVLDLIDVPYIDSAGLGFLVSRYVRVHRRGGDLKLVHLSSHSSHVLEITHLMEVFQAFDSVEGALQAFHQAASRPAERPITAPS